MSENRKAIEAEIDADWLAGRFDAAYEKISNRLCRILRDSIVSRGTAYHDAEDVVGAAMFGFAVKLNKDGPESIVEPCHYLQVSVSNRLHDQKEKRANLPIGERDERDNRQIIEAATRPTRNNRVIFLLQEVGQIDEIAESDAKRLVAAVLKQMRPIYRRILRDLLKNGPRGFVAEKAARIGVKPGTYAGQRKRAFKIFRQLAQATADRLGINWRGLTEEEIDVRDFLAPIENETEEPDASAGFL